MSPEYRKNRERKINVWVVVTHTGHGEETMVQGVYATKRLAEDAFFAARRRAATAAFMPRTLYGHVEKHEIVYPVGSQGG